MRRHLVSRVLPGFAIIGRAQFRSKRLRALPASYALTGSDANLRLGTLLVLDAGVGTFALSGQAASLLLGRRVSAAGASFALTGQDAILQKRKTIAAEAASFALTGQDSGLKVARRVVAEVASFALTGTAATMRKGLNLAADAASFALAGQDAGLRVARKMVAAAASFAVTGQTAALKLSKRVSAAAASFALTGQNVTLTLATGPTVIGTAGIATTSNRGFGTNDGVHPGFRFTATASGVLSSVSFDVATVFATRTWHAELWTNNSGSPGSQVGVDSDGVSVSTTGVKSFPWATKPSITSGTTYWIVFQPDSNAADVVALNVGADQAGYGSGRNTTITSITDSLGVELKVGVTQN